MMPARSLQDYANLLSDALDRVLANPTASHCWSNLMTLTRAYCDAGHDYALLLELVRVLQQAVAPEGSAGFYLALYLDFATLGKPQLGAACALVRSMMPYDLDRMSAFFFFAWQISLSRSHDRKSFLDALRHSELPALGALMGQLVAQRQSVRLTPRVVAQIKKVAVVAPSLLSKQSTPSMMALDQAQVLIQNGMQVALFSCQEAAIPDFSQLLGNGFENQITTFELEPVMRERGLNLAVTLGDAQFSLLRRTLEMLEQIKQFDPDLVLIIGLHSCLAHALYQVRPVLAMGVNSIAPMLPFDAWLAARPDALARPWGDYFPAGLVWHYPYRLHRKPVTHTVTRSELGLTAHAVVLVSSAWYLPLQIDEAWLKRMVALVQQHTNVVWLLLGSDSVLQAPLQALSAQQLRLLPFTGNVMGVFACCDIYVNPPRMGGGFAVADAMAAGLPAVSFADSDGGDKLGAAESPDEASFFATLLNLIHDAGLRAQVGAQMRARFDQCIDLAQAGPGMASACQAALAHYQQRMRQTESESKAGPYP